MLRIPYWLDSRLTDGGEVVSPTHRPLSTPKKHFFFSFWYSFMLEADQKSGPSVAERIRYSEKFNDFIRTQTHDLGACGIVPQPTMLINISITINYFIFVNNILFKYHFCLSSRCQI
jgi:hypothetical protein